MTLYEVISVEDEGKVRLIEAKTRAGARAFAARESLKVEKCTPSRAHVLAARGVEIESEKEETE